VKDDLFVYFFDFFVGDFWHYVICFGVLYSFLYKCLKRLGGL